MRKIGKKVVMVTAAAAIAIGGGAAWAFVTGSGTGSGTAGTGEAPKITLSAVAAAPLELGAKTDVNVTVSADKGGAHVSVLDPRAGHREPDLASWVSHRLVRDLQFSAELEWRPGSEDAGYAGAHGYGDESVDNAERS